MLTLSEIKSGWLLLMNAYKKIIKIYKRTIIIGDIHGCYDEMMELLDKIKFTSSDLLISVGDMVDRGPKSWEVVDFFRNGKNTLSVLGNHERRVVGVVKGTSEPAWSQLQSLSQISVEKQVDYAGWFDSLPSVIETENVIVTHARLSPEVNLTEQDPYYTCAVGGSNIKIETDSNGVPYWYYDWINSKQINKTVCIGHISYNQVELVKNGLYALDTKAVESGKLSALILPGYKIASVDVKRNYYEENFNQWKFLTLFNLEPDNIKINEIEKMYKKEHKTEQEISFITRIKDSISEYDFERRLELLRPLIQLKLGTIPEENIFRKEYFSKLNLLPLKSDVIRFIKYILTRTYSVDKIILILFPVKTLRDVNNIFKDAEEYFL